MDRTDVDLELLAKYMNLRRSRARFCCVVILAGAGSIQLFLKTGSRER